MRFLSSESSLSTSYNLTTIAATTAHSTTSATLTAHYPFVAFQNNYSRSPHAQKPSSASVRMGQSAVPRLAQTRQLTTSMSIAAI